MAHRIESAMVVPGASSVARAVGIVTAAAIRQGLSDTDIEVEDI